MVWIGEFSIKRKESVLYVTISLVNGHWDRGRGLQSRVGCKCRLDIAIVPVAGLAVLQEPVDSFLQALLPGRRLAPAESQQLLVADEVAAVVEGTVANVDNLLGGETKVLGNIVGDVHHGALLLRANVVRLANLGEEISMIMLCHPVYTLRGTNTGLEMVDWCIPWRAQHE